MYLDTILEAIRKADDEEITKLAGALIERQKQLHPDWEAIYISLPLEHPDECRQIMCGAWEILTRVIAKESKQCCSDGQCKVSGFRM